MPSYKLFKNALGLGIAGTGLSMFSETLPTNAVGVNAARGLQSASGALPAVGSIMGLEAIVTSTRRLGRAARPRRRRR